MVKAAAVHGPRGGSRRLIVSVEVVLEVLENLTQ